MILLQIKWFTEIIKYLIMLLQSVSFINYNVPVSNIVTPHSIKLLNINNKISIIDVI